MAGLPIFSSHGILVVLLCWLPPAQSFEQQQHRDVITFFVCSEDAQDNLTSLVEVEECGDLLAYVGVKVAKDVVNSASSQLQLDFHTIQLGAVATASSSEIFLETFQQYAKIVKKISLFEVRTFIGPPTLRQTNAIAPLFGDGFVISYSIDSNLIRFKHVDRTMPRISLINQGRLALTTEYNWIRAGNLFSFEEEYIEAALEFATLFPEHVSHLTDANLAPRLLMSLVFGDVVHTIELQLLALKNADMRIIHGFFGAEDAKNILCKAKKYQLTTPSHVWILPAYPNPNWWRRRPLDNNSSCTDREMLDILQSTIFVGGVKLPPFDTTLSMFVPQLLTKATQLFPALTSRELLPFLLNSRAVNAYDSIILAANTINSHSSGENHIIDPCLLECEECRIYTPTFVDDDVSGNCSVRCPKGYDVAALCSEGHGERDSTSDAYAEGNLHYGQVMYTQFIDGHHCPMALWWGTTNSTRARENFRRVSELADCECEDEDVLNDMAAFFRNFTEEYNCPPDFVWKGEEDDPPVAIVIEVSSISRAALAMIGAFSGLGIGMAICFCILNVVLRNDKIVKASSPYLNLVILAGYILILPNVFFYGVLQMSNLFPEIPPAVFSFFCEITSWSNMIGFCLIFSTILAKTWRLYWIFSRKSMSLEPTKALKDTRLLLGIAVLTLFVVLTMIVRLSISHYFYAYKIVPLSESDFTPFQRHLVSFRSLNLTFFTADQPLFTILVLPGMTFAYYGVLIILSLVLIVRNKRIYSNFRDDSLYSFRTLVLSSVMLILECAGYIALTASSNLFLFFFWVSVASLVACNIISQLVTFCPLVYKVYTSRRKERALRSEETHNNELLSQYVSATAVERELRRQLEDKEQAIAELKARAGGQKHSLTTDSVSSETSVTDSSVFIRRSN